MSVTTKKYRLKLNSLPKIEELLQSLYDETDSSLVTIQREMNKLSNSINLNDEIVDSKTKYAKAMNDYLANKDKVIGRRLEIAKVMSEIRKFDGSQGSINIESGLDWELLKNKIDDNEIEEIKEDKTKIEKYSLK